MKKEKRIHKKVLFIILNKAKDVFSKLPPLIDYNYEE